MIIRDENLEYLARDIGDRYNGLALVEKMKKIGIPEQVIEYPNTKWRMLYQIMQFLSEHKNQEYALSKLAKIIELSIHPLNHSACWSDSSEQILNEFNNRLEFDNLVIERSDADYVLKPKESSSKQFKTSTDYIIEAISFFRKEYNKIRIPGIEYDYELGKKVNEDELSESMIDSEYSQKLRALEKLKEAKFILDLKVSSNGSTLKRTQESNDTGSNKEEIYFASCRIDETKLTGEAPKDKEIEKLTQKVLHTHRFENSAQEKEITFNIQKTARETAFTKFPYRLPAGTLWNQITIVFISINSIEIHVKGNAHGTGYADMGFANMNSGKPNKQWSLLYALAKNNGNISFTQENEMPKIQKQKETLSRKLQHYFSLDTDPFEPYSTKNGYTTKFTTFIKEPSSPKTISKETEEDEDFEDFYNELTH
jgi:hypothetical protein